MKTGEIEGAREELENMKVKAETKVPDVMKVAVREKSIQDRARERWNVSPLFCNKPPAVRLRGREARIPDRALSHLQLGIKPIFQPRDNKAQGYRTSHP